MYNIYEEHTVALFLFLPKSSLYSQKWGVAKKWPKILNMWHVYSVLPHILREYVEYLEMITDSTLLAIEQCDDDKVIFYSLVHREKKDRVVIWARLGQKKSVPYSCEKKNLNHQNNVWQFLGPVFRSYVCL